MTKDVQLRVETARFSDLVRRAVFSNRAVFSDFLTPDAQMRLCALARREGLESARFGGSADAERAVVGIWQPGCDADESPIQIICLKWDARYAAPLHRDVLGAYLGLGLERETLGDIRLEGDKAYLAMLPAMAQYVIGNMQSVGRASVKISLHTGDMPSAEIGVRTVVNVPSLRLDAVLAQTLHLPRTKAQTLIRAGAVNLNWQETLKTDRDVDDHDVISVRGHGRIKVHGIQGESRKGRLFIEVETFLKP